MCFDLQEDRLYREYLERKNEEEYALGDDIDNKITDTTNVISMSKKEVQEEFDNLDIEKYN